MTFSILPRVVDTVKAGLCFAHFQMHALDAILVVLHNLQFKRRSGS